MKPYQALRTAAGPARKQIAYALRVSTSRFNRQCRDPEVSGEPGVLDSTKKLFEAVRDFNPPGVPILIGYLIAVSSDSRASFLSLWEIATAILCASARAVRELLRPDATIEEKHAAVAELWQATHNAFLFLHPREERPRAPKLLTDGGREEEPYVFERRARLAA